MKKVFVIVPNYNHQKFLKQRIESILAQKKNIRKVLLLDDFSTDKSVQLLESYITSPLFDLNKNKINSGDVFKQWKRGLEIVDKNDLVWIAESDDFCHPEFLKKIIKPFSDPNVVLSYSRSIDVNEKGENLGLSYSHLDWCNNGFVKEGLTEILDHLYYQCTIPNISAVVFRRSAVDDSFFDHDYKLCGDWFFYMKILQKGRVAYTSMPLNFHRFHNSTIRSKFNNKPNVLLERLDIIKRIKVDCKIPILRYLKSAHFQIKHHVFSCKLPEVINCHFLNTIIKIVKINPVFLLLLFYALFQRISIRLMHNFR